MRALLFVSLALVACKEENPDFCPAHPGEQGCPNRMDGGPSDGPDAAIDADPIDARLDIGAGMWAVHLNSAPSSPITLPATVDTSNSTNPCASTSTLWATTASSQPAACFIVATTITISSTVTVTGSRPLVLVASDKIVVSSVLNGSSEAGGNIGPYASFATCGTGTAPATNSSGGGGGAGGSFITQGGNGGKGNANQTDGGTPAAAAANPTVLRSGCKGQNGGTGGTAGTGGEGGGAITLIAGNTIDLVGGTINVSGAGGGTASNRGGGGGGGSGGMLVLQSPAILTDNATRLVSNGGGGASGANGSAVGGNPNPATPGTAASGGAPSGGCSNENGGGVGNIDTGSGGNGNNVTMDSCGGGGGGGGGGYIWSSVAIGAGQFSPSPDIP